MTTYKKNRSRQWTTHEKNASRQWTTYVHNANKYGAFYIGDLEDLGTCNNKHGFSIVEFDGMRAVGPGRVWARVLCCRRA